jgi:hypothetical protein
VTRTTEEWRWSIGARLTAAHTLLTLAVADLTLEQVNHVERAGVLPIAFSLMHVVGSEDRSVTRHLGGGPSVWDSADWAERIGLVGPIPYRGTSIDEAMTVRLGDLDAWRQYQQAVFMRTEHVLANAPLALFDEDAFPDGRPPSSQGSFLQTFVPDGPILVRDVCEAYLFQHAARHLGEIEHGRALVGLQGLS